MVDALGRLRVERAVKVLCKEPCADEQSALSLVVALALPVDDHRHQALVRHVDAAAGLASLESSFGGGLDGALDEPGKVIADRFRRAVVGQDEDWTGREVHRPLFDAVGVRAPLWQSHQGRWAVVVVESGRARRRGGGEREVRVLEPQEQERAVDTVRRAGREPRGVLHDPGHHQRRRGAGRRAPPLHRPREEGAQAGDPDDALEQLGGGVDVEQPPRRRGKGRVDDAHAAKQADQSGAVGPLSQRLVCLDQPGHHELHVHVSLASKIDLVGQSDCGVRHASRRGHRGFAIGGAGHLAVARADCRVIAPLEISQSQARTGRRARSGRR